MAKQLIFSLLLLLSNPIFAQQVTYRKAFFAMGCGFEIAVTAGSDSADWAHEMIDTAVANIYQIERQISSWDAQSQTSAINQMAGIEPVIVEPELFALIARCTLLGQLTDGAFDISFAAMAGIWQFDAERRHEWPDSSAVQNRLPLVDYQKIVLDAAHSSVFLSDSGMRIGFGGVGKGYAADATARLLQQLGVKNGVINASGDLFCWGHDAQMLPWRVAVVNPKNKNEVLLWLEANKRAVVTSGDYEKYKIRDNKRYAHIINPKTGFPVSGITSATVVAPRAEFADALATTLFVLGVDAGLKLINSLPDVECIIIDDQGRIHTSENIVTTQ